MPADIRAQLQTTLGNAYSLERELGGGGMSRVFVASETRLRRRVVVKVLSPELAQGISAERFEREIQTAASLQQANIVPVLAVGETGGIPYYTMPFVEGESLRTRLGRGGAMSVSEAISVLRDVARALVYAHERGIVHRDIKPDNVLLSGGAAVVTDFGIAKAISASRTAGSGGTLTQLGTAIGTPAYISPEQAAGDPDVDHRADIYSFGCMAFELLAGRPPFVGKLPHRLMAAHMSEQPPSLVDLRQDTPLALAGIVMRCLEKDPTARPQSATELLPALEATTSGDAGFPAMPSILLGGSGMLRRALAFYGVAFVAVAVIAKAAIVGIGLPDWVFPGALIVMALGLPAILFTAYTQYVARRAVTASPTFTPGGTPSMASHGTIATLAMKASPHMSWRRTWMWGGYSVGAFVLLVGGFMTLRAMGVGPAGSLLASGKLSASDQILVADFKATGADSVLSGVLAEAMRSSLTRSRRVQVVQASAIAGALRRMERPIDSRIDLALAREIAAREGVRAIVAGEVTAVSGGYLVTVKLLSGSTEDVLTSFQLSANGAKDLIPTIDQLGRELRSKIGESLRDVQGAPPLARVVTPSLEALKKFSEGARFNDIEGVPAKAVAPLREAIALDSNFGMAYRKLAVVLNSLGDTARRSVIARGYALRDRLPEAERLALLGTYYMYGPHPDRPRTIESYEQLFNKYPEWLTIITTDLLASAYESRREFARAESLWTGAITVAPDEHSPFYDVIRPQIALGKFAEAKRSLARARTHKPPATAVLDRYEALILYNEGKMDSVAAVFARNASSSNPAIARGGRFDVAALALRGGRIAEWARVNAQLNSQPGQSLPRPLESPLGVQLAARMGRDGEARRRLDAFLSSSQRASIPAADRALNEATLQAQVGRVREARSLVALYDATVKDSVRLRVEAGTRHFSLGWLALAEGRHADAVAEFRQSERAPDGPASACPICTDQPVALAFDRAGQGDSAITVMEHYLNTPFMFRFGLDVTDLPMTLRRLGDLYEAKGDVTRAIQYFQRFVELWKNADAELQPAVEEARQRIRRLESLRRRSG